MIAIKFNVRERDLASAVAEAKEKTADLFERPYRAVWDGEFNEMEQAQKRLMLVIPLSLTLIFILLYMAFHSLLDAVVVLGADVTCSPFNDPVAEVIVFDGIDLTPGIAEEWDDSDEIHWMHSDVSEVKRRLLEFHLVEVEWLEQDISEEYEVRRELIENLGGAIKYVDRVVLLVEIGDDNALQTRPKYRASWCCALNIAFD